MMQHDCRQAYRIVRKAFDAALIIGLVGSFLILLVIVCPIGPASAESNNSSSVNVPPNNPNSLVSRDVYYYEKFKVQGIISGPPAPRLQRQDYPERFGESRLIVWVLAQQHLYWGGAALGVLALVTIFEFLGLAVGESARGQWYEGLAHEMLGLIMLSFSLTAILGGMLLFALLSLYPDLTKYLIGIFRPTVLLYGLLVLVFSLLAYLYYYTWQGIGSAFLKWTHLTLGVLVNASGTILVLVSNAWGSFMQSPAGVDEYGRFLGNFWHVVHTALWNPLNIHRVMGNVILGGAVIAAYAAYRALTAETVDEKVRYDRMGYIVFLMMVIAIFTVPFSGYWLSREIYAYSQQMGITMFGGLLAWLGLILVSVIGLLFLGINYYLWQRITSTEVGGRYAPFGKYAFLILGVCVGVYVTPHTLVMTPLELLNMGGQQHPVLGNYGVESAKQTAVNMMMVVTICSLMLFWACRRWPVVWADPRGAVVIAGLVVGGMANLLWLGIYGYFIPANVRIGLQVPMAATTFSIGALGVILAFLVRPGARKPEHAWGTLSVRGYFALIFLAFLVTWVMGLGGYRRSSLRLFWHVNEIMRDNSPWAFTHSVGFAVNMISLNAILFWCGLLFILWLARLGHLAVSKSKAAYVGSRQGTRVAESRGSE